MPFAAQRPCNGSPTCHRPATYRGRCQEHARTQEKARYNADTRKWYCTTDWAILRQAVLADDPICVMCKIAPSTDVDHKVPHRGNYILFWDRDNLQGLCKSCHSAKTQKGQ